MSKTKYRTLRLDATVLAGPDYRRLVDQDTLAQWLGSPTSETLRNWVKKGMPREGTESRPRYPVPDCVVWHRYYEVRKATAGGGGVGHVTVESAQRWALEQEAEREPNAWVLVPLYHDHPARRRQLEKAAAGRKPSPDEDDA